MSSGKMALEHSVRIHTCRSIRPPRRRDDITWRVVQSLPRSPLRRVPGRALPAGAGRACRPVLHPSCVERCPPASLIVLGQLEIKALVVHPEGDVADAGPGVQPGAQHVERAVVRRSGEPGEAEGGSQESAPLVEHELLDLVRP